MTVLWLFASTALAHGVTGEDKAFLQQTTGPQPIVFKYLGAKHMVTGHGHLLFLFGVVFLVYRMAEVVDYVTLFAVGHSMTLLYGGRDLPLRWSGASAGNRTPIADPCRGKTIDAPVLEARQRRVVMTELAIKA